ncbi:PREDICTED: GMP reductase 2-like [Priapulus caudatus]|uniref:GMP reductase n=1 Tax=Priapulus caudatus TaxID=37621 RepID=A0ABM1EUG1_PRICU|nr:PREDICTED: GMP reductase 2-like [Priapulus caudatus]
MPRIDNDIKLDFKDVLFRPKRSTLKSRSEVDLSRPYIFRNSNVTYEGIPVIASNMDTVGTFEMAKVLAKNDCFTTIHKHYSIEEWKEFALNNKDLLGHIAASSGSSAADLEKLKAINEAVPEIKYICLDVANGYSEHFVDFVRRARKEFPEHTIIAGNVVTGEMVEELILSGADIIKVGIGPGSVCTTRKKAGVGYPQLSAVIECADAAHGLGGHIISESTQRRDRCDNRFYWFADMILLSSSSEITREASEGKTVEIPYRGDVAHTLLDILGGIRSACTYVGAGKLKELSKRTTFIRVTQQVNEVYAPHSVPTTRAAQTMPTKTALPAP